MNPRALACLLTVIMNDANYRISPCISVNELNVLHFTVNTWPGGIGMFALVSTSPGLPYCSLQFTVNEFGNFNTLQITSNSLRHS